MKEALGLSLYAPPSAVSALRDLCDTLRFLRLVRCFAANPSLLRFSHFRFSEPTA